ncbi:MAG: type IV pilus assembly protein PilM [Rhodoglobus sp.]
MGKTIVGLDISSSSIRAAELDGPLKSKPTLVRYHAVRGLPSGAVVKGEVMEPRTVADALKQLWSVGKFGTKNVVLGVGNARVLARDLSVPKMPLNTIKGSLPFYVQEMLPFPAKDALLDFYPMSESLSESGPVINGLFVAAPKSAVMGNIEAVQLAGLNTVNVDLIPFALSRVLLSSARTAGTAAMIDVGGTTTTVVISSQGVPQFVRLIPSGGDDVTAALVSRLRLSPEDAENAKRSAGLAMGHTPTSGADAASIVYELTGKLITSLRETLNYFAGSRPNTPVSRVVLSGGGSMLRGFREALSEYTRLPVSVGDPFEMVSTGRTTTQSPDVGSSLSVAIGLAMGNAA